MIIKFYGDLWVTPQTVRYDTFINEADLIFCNLETPVTNSNYNILKNGPAIAGTLNCFESTIKGLTQRPLVFSLANNHMGDHGEQGIFDTVSACQKNDILYGGISKGNLYKPLIIPAKEGNLGILFISDKEFGVSLDSRLGVDYITPRIYSSIVNLRKQCDILIVSIHSGSEWNSWVSPMWQDTLRSFIDCGADFVYGHHSHVPQGWEQYKSGWIAYGLGNFVVPTDRFHSKNNSLWSLCISLEIGNKHIQNASVVPIDININSDNNSIDIVKSDIENHATYIQNLNPPLSDRQFLMGLWQSFAFMRFDGMLASFQVHSTQNNIELSPQSKVKRFRHVYHVLKNRYDKVFSDTLHISEKELSSEIKSERYRNMYNWYACIPHRNTMETVLSVLTGQQDDYRTEQTDTMVRQYVFDLP